MRMTRQRACGLVLAAAAAAPAAARATWSIVLVNTETKEIAIGSATCLTGFDLKRWLPVMRVGLGGACAQAQVDTFAQNRMLIFNQLALGTAPADMLPLLDAQDGAHESRQYGIVDTLGRAVTFTGSSTFEYSDGVTGQQGDLVYAIQGNILTGAPVVDDAEDAILNTSGDMLAKLMAGMQAARAAGGDGRCSCDPNAPTSCGAPPEMFDKSAHVGFMIDARIGDTDGTCTFTPGCASGSYYMVLNVAFQTDTDPDPVAQLQTLFDAFRTSLIGVPDAVQSTVSFSPPQLVANGSATSTMTITLKDWQGTQGGAGLTVTVVHDTGSAGETSIGAVQDDGGGSYSATLTAGTNTGIDRFKVTIDDGAGGMRPVILTPSPELELVDATPGDLDGDGDVDLVDFAAFGQCFGGANNPPAGSCPPGVDADFDNDGDVDLIDFATFAQNFTGSQ
jgi:uncharacterized Ntn-hydrolase superfamily protein